MVATFNQTLEAGLKPKYLFLLGIIALCCALEITLFLSDLGIIGPAYLRFLSYDFGAFWPGLLGNWKPNYALQPYAMFLTYGFLHGGLVHLAVNMVALWLLGRRVISRVGQGGFIVLYLSASFCGAGCFALLSSGLRPMVGASGSLFGLMGTVLVWEYMDRRTDADGLRLFTWMILILAVLSAVLWWAMNGQLAWQAHLGGGVVGLAAAILIDRRWPKR